MNVRNMLSILSDAGVEVDLLTYPLGQDTPMNGLRINRLPKPPLVNKIPIGPSWLKIILDLEMAWAAYRLASREKYVLVHAIEEAVYIGLMLKKRFDLPLLYDMDSSLKEQMASYGFARLKVFAAFFAAMERAALKGSDRIITVCQALTDIAAQEAPDKPICQIEDIPLTAESPENPPDEKELTERMGGRTILLYTGNFEIYQGVHILVEAMPAVLLEHPDTLLVLVGGSGRPLDRVRDLARRLGIEQAVLFLEPRPPSQMSWFMEKASALLSPRLKGINTPLKVYTYLQSGRPVVATRLLTHTQVLEDEWAVLVEPDARGMTSGILRLLADPEEASAIGQRGSRLVEERYSMGHFRRKLLGAYDRLGGYRFEE
jgi:glycosyltransferase involved in cell wall biosynthesis